MRYHGIILLLKMQSGILLFNGTYQEVFMSLAHTTIYFFLVFTKAVVIKINHSTISCSQARLTLINLRLANTSCHRSSPNDGNNKSTADMILTHRGWRTGEKSIFSSIYRHTRSERRGQPAPIVMHKIQTKSKIWIFSHFCSVVVGSWGSITPMGRCPN